MRAVAGLTALLDIPREAVEATNIQVIRHSTDIVWLYLIHVWMACAREGNLARSRSLNVRLSVSTNLCN